MMASYKAALSAAILLTKQDDAILCVALGSGSFLNVVAVLVDVCVCVCVCVCVFLCVCVFGGDRMFNTYLLYCRLAGWGRFAVLGLFAGNSGVVDTALESRKKGSSTGSALQGEVIPMNNSDGYCHFNYLES